MILPETVHSDFMTGHDRPKNMRFRYGVCRKEGVGSTCQIMIQTYPNLVLPCSICWLEPMWSNICSLEAAYCWLLGQTILELRLQRTDFGWCRDAQVFFLMVLLLGLVYLFGLLFTQLLDGKNQLPGNRDWLFSSDLKQVTKSILFREIPTVLVCSSVCVAYHLASPICWRFVVD